MAHQRGLSVHFTCICTLPNSLGVQKRHKKRHHALNDTRRQGNAIRHVADSAKTGSVICRQVGGRALCWHLLCMPSLATS